MVTTMSRVARQAGMVFAAAPMAVPWYGSDHPGRTKFFKACNVVLCNDESHKTLPLKFGATNSQVTIRSALSVNPTIQEHYPTLLLGIKKGFFSMEKVIEEEVMIKVHKCIPVDTKLVRTRHAITSEMKFEIYSSIQGKFPDVSIADAIAAFMADEVYNAIENGIKAAEADQSWLDWLSRNDVWSKINLPVHFTYETDSHTTIAMMEGSTRLQRVKDASGKDKVHIKLQIDVKALFVNRNFANDIETDPEIVRQVREAPNKLTQRLMNRNPSQTFPAVNPALMSTAASP